jgi:HEAT repeat protein
VSASRSEDAKLERLSLLALEEPSPALAAELRQLLANSSHHVVAQAAQIAAKSRLAELAEELVAAFERFLIDPLKSDKNCVGKIAIVDALNELDYQPPDVFLKGMRYIQMEPRWGKSEDAADAVRAGSAIGLVRIDYRGVLPILVDLLNDEARTVRIAAAQSLAAHASDAALLLLRLKARLGDKSAEVVGECLGGLMRVTPQESLPFVAEFLTSGDATIAESALLALGNSHQPEAFEILKSFWQKNVVPDLRETTLLAISLLRLPTANDFLLALLKEAPESTAALALSVLAVHFYDQRLYDRVTATVSERSNSVLSALLKQKSENRD